MCESKCLCSGLLAEDFFHFPLGSRIINFFHPPSGLTLPVLVNARGDSLALCHCVVGLFVSGPVGESLVVFSSSSASPRLSGWTFWGSAGIRSNEKAATFSLLTVRLWLDLCSHCFGWSSCDGKKNKQFYRSSQLQPITPLIGNGVTCEMEP